jgi:hypothetical protein
MIMNANSARDWFLASTKYKVHVAKHFIALSTNTKAVAEFGIAKENIERCWPVDHFLRGVSAIRAAPQGDSSGGISYQAFLAVISIWYNGFYSKLFSLLQLMH